MPDAGLLLPSWALWFGAAVAVVALIFAVISGLLWWRQRGAIVQQKRARVAAEDQRIDSELALAELRDRLRVMTDIHDAAAVTITSIISQAEGAKVAAEIDAGVATRVAGSIADQARGALADLRRVTNVGRQGDASGQPMPTLGSIDELFQGINDSGLIIRFEESGTAFGVSSSAEIAVYRIVQEALNNARQHGGPGTTVKVSMSWSGNGLQVRIDDDGIRVRNLQREQWGSGHNDVIAEDQKALVEALDGRGMKEMRTRTEAFGGVFSAHRVPGVGFSVSAAFPTLRFHTAVTPMGLGPRITSPVSDERDAS